MTELDELRERVHQSSGWPPVNPAGAQMTRRAAARRTRRRRVAVVGGAAAVVCAIAVAPITLGGTLNDNRATDPTSAPSSQDNPPSGQDNPPSGQDSLEVAKGYRPVGALGLVFEVPKAWGTDSVACDGSPSADTVAFGGGRDCLVPNPPQVSSLLITTSDNHLVSGILRRITLSPADVGVPDVRVSDPVDIDGLWTFAVADQAGNVAVVRTKEGAVARHMRDALRVIPEGYVVIPQLPGSNPDEVRAALVDVGLNPSVEQLPSPNSLRGVVMAIEPPVATIVPIGGVVDVVVEFG